MNDNHVVHGEDKRGKAMASFILGLVSMITWIIPLIGLPTTVIGLIMGIVGRRSSRRGLAIAGIVLSSIFLLATIANAGFGVYLFTQMDWQAQ